MSQLRKYLKPANYANQIVTIANRTLLHQIEAVMAPTETTPFRHSPIFLLGAPRSGSTLIFQVITDAFRLGYLSNAHCCFFGAPALAERLLHPVANKPISDYQSDYGLTRGKHAPSECAEWWYRFFRREPAYVPLEEADPVKMRCFRRSLLSLTKAFDNSVVFKNLYASLRVQPIIKYIPEALFIVVRRNEVDNAISILEARVKCYGNYDTWFSVPPPDIDLLRRLPVAQQIIGQIRSIYQTISRDLKSKGNGRLLLVEYEEFCKNVHGSLDEIASFLIKNGVKVEKGYPVPTSFPRGAAARIPDDLYRAVVKMAKGLQQLDVLH